MKFPTLRKILNELDTLLLWAEGQGGETLTVDEKPADFNPTMPDQKSPSVDGGRREGDRKPGTMF